MEKVELIKNVSTIDDEAKDKKKARGVITTRGSSSSNNHNSNNSSLVMRCCQADKCSADLTDAKQYHRRHKVCEHHAKAQLVIVAGLRQRFCQQCSRFHEISEFDELKKSCRRRLAGHNERRRKNTGDNHLQFSHVETNSKRK